MPLQNRVTPFGEIVAMTQRGLFIGNRGIIHDPTTKTLLPRRWSLKAWLVCVCDYKGVRRDVMARRSWTELFFLDEATALAAGHRPCFACRRAAATRFRLAWQAVNSDVARVAEIDAQLHRERVEGRRKRLHPITLRVSDLPTGAMLAAGSASFLVTDGLIRQWTPDGYRACRTPPAFDAMLTPPSTMRVLKAGYQPVLHPSVTMPVAVASRRD